MADLNFKVNGSSETATRLNAVARDFSIVVDEPPALGGEDKGANPVEYLLASYAGCLNVVAHLTAKELGIVLQGLKISVSGNLNPDKLFGNETEDRAGFKNIVVDFEPVTVASEEELDHWVKVIKQRCPVNDNLTNPTPLHLNLNRKVAYSN
ncbi:OsmC family protein [Saccharicrinis sp. FJH2]|uniref:OsmC family protein n=1 Tax=unclassified Saccharicrinis TaxID=2646859 RepID=UPI0035D48B64